MKNPTAHITRISGLRRWREATAALIAAAGIAVGALAATAHTGPAHQAAIGSVGYADSTGDDYPGYRYGTYDPPTVDPITKFYIGNCTDFVAWRLQHEGLNFTNGYAGAHWGNAWQWKNAAQVTHTTIDPQPQPGDVAVFPAWWPTYRVGDYKDNLTYDAGHVAIVDSVNKDGSVNVEDYNWQYIDNHPVPGGQYHQHTLSANGVTFLHFPVYTPQPTKDLTLRVADASLAGHYASARLNSSDVVQAYATRPGPWERFTFIPVPGKAGAFYLKSQATNKYVSARFNLPGNQRGTLYATAATSGPWETFYEQHVGADQAFYVYDGSGTKWYVATEMNNGGVLRARTTPAAFNQNVDHGSWELFYVGS